MMNRSLITFVLAIALATPVMFAQHKAGSPQGKSSGSAITNGTPPSGPPADAVTGTDGSGLPGCAPGAAFCLIGTPPPSGAPPGPTITNGK